MSEVTSKDGTSIAYDRAGNGPPVVLVCGGSVDRMSNAPLAQLLSVICASSGIGTFGLLIASVTKKVMYR